MERIARRGRDEREGHRHRLHPAPERRLRRLDERAARADRGARHRHRPRADAGRDAGVPRARRAAQAPLPAAGRAAARAAAASRARDAPGGGAPRAARWRGAARRGAALDARPPAPTVQREHRPGCDASCADVVRKVQQRSHFASDVRRTSTARRRARPRRRRPSASATMQQRRPARRRRPRAAPSTPAGADDHDLGLGGRGQRARGAQRLDRGVHRVAHLAQEQPLLAAGRRARRRSLHSAKCTLSHSASSPGWCCQTSSAV